MERIDHGGDVYGGNAGLLDFSVCLNPAGAPQPVLRAAQEGVLRQGYPDPQCRGLVRAAAQRDGVEESMVLWGRDSPGAGLPPERRAGRVEVLRRD